MLSHAAEYWEDMPTSLRYDRVIAAGTSRKAGALFLCSNLPYLLLAVLFGCHADLQFPHAGGLLCQQRELYVALSVLMWAVSSAMHMLQLQSCRTTSTGCLLCMKHADVVCVLSMIWTPVLCARSLMPLWYMVPCLPLFVISQHYKKEGQVAGYLLWHSLWHVGTAAVAGLYVVQHWTG